MTLPQSDNISNYIDSSQKKTAGWISLYWKAIASEFFATMFLVAFGCMACIPIEGLASHPPMYIPFAFGLAVMICVQIFGHISGAAMNPFIAVQAVLWGRIPITVGIAFIIAELVGGCVGYGILVGVAPVDMAGDAVCLSLPSASITGIQAACIEMVLSAALSLVNCSVWDPVNEDKMDSVSLKYALTISGLALAGGPLSGGSMNPARSFAPALWSNRWESHWVYWVGPFVGGLVPAIFYKYVWLQKPETKLP